MMVFVWWDDYSNQLQMTSLGYNFEGLNEAERFRGVSSEDIEKLSQLEIKLFGIGWHLKGIFGSVVYSLFLIIVYFFGHFLNKRKV